MSYSEGIAWFRVCAAPTRTLSSGGARWSFAAALVAAAAESVRQHGVFKQAHRRESTVVVVPPQEKEEKALEAWQLEGWTLVDHQSEQAEIAA